MGILHKDHKAEELEIRFKFLSDSVLKAFEKDGRKYCRLTASSNAEDLVGDVMSQKALEQEQGEMIIPSRASDDTSHFGIRIWRNSSVALSD